MKIYILEICEKTNKSRLNSIANRLNHGAKQSELNRRKSRLKLSTPRTSVHLGVTCFMRESGAHSAPRALPQSIIAPCERLKKSKWVSEFVPASCLSIQSSGGVIQGALCCCCRKGKALTIFQTANDIHLRMMDRPLWPLC